MWGMFLLLLQTMQLNIVLQTRAKVFKNIQRLSKSGHAKNKRKSWELK